MWQVFPLTQTIKPEWFSGHFRAMLRNNSQALYKMTPLCIMISPFKKPYYIYSRNLMIQSFVIYFFTFNQIDRS